MPNLTAARAPRSRCVPHTNESTLKYYGIGNASPLPPAIATPVEDGVEYWQRMHPTLSVEARYRVFEHFYVMVGSVYTHNWLTVRPTTILEASNSAGGPAEVRAILGSFDSHGVELPEARSKPGIAMKQTARAIKFHTARFV